MSTQRWAYLWRRHRNHYPTPQIMTGDSALTSTATLHPDERNTKSPNCHKSGRSCEMPCLVWTWISKNRNPNFPHISWNRRKRVFVWLIRPHAMTNAFSLSLISPPRHRRLLHTVWTLASPPVYLYFCLRMCSSQTLMKCVKREPLNTFKPCSNPLFMPPVRSSWHLTEHQLCLTAL